MSINGPEPKTPPHSPNKLSTFALRKLVQSPTKYKSLTNLPRSEFIDSLEILPRSVQAEIKKCLKTIYSHVTERKPSEGSEHFFIHPAATVYYEAYKKILIKGKDHAKKAQSVSGNIKKTITLIDNTLQKFRLNQDQIDKLTVCKNVLIVHRDLLADALDATTSQIKDHLTLHQGYDSEEENMGSLSPNSKVVVRECYPETPSPEKDKTTPKHLRDVDRESISRLTNCRKKLFPESPPRSDSKFEESDDSSGSDDDRILQVSKKELVTNYKRKKIEISPFFTSQFGCNDGFDDFGDDFNDSLTDLCAPGIKRNVFSSDSDCSDGADSDSEEKSTEPAKKKVKF